MPEEAVTFGAALELDTGGMMPDAPVDKNVAVDPPVEKNSIPDETEVFGKAAKDELGTATLDGGMIPPVPVEKVVAVDPAVEKNSMPEDTVTVAFNPGAELLKGGIMPLSPVDIAVNVLLPSVRLALSKLTDSEIVRETLGTGLGGMIPSAPVLINIAVAPDEVYSDEPTDTVTMTALELEIAWMVCDAALGLPDPKGGVTIVGVGEALVEFVG
jgi:hypothetical protein